MTIQTFADMAGAQNSPATLQSANKGGKPSAGEARKAEIRKAAVQFQSIFVEMMLKSMRDTVHQDKLTGGGHGEEVYGSLLDREYAAAISRRGNIGLAEMVERQLLAQGKGSEKTNIRDGAGISSDGQTIKTNKIEGSHEN
jgi:peptidoglycan hydrolase FlgJ